MADIDEAARIAAEHAAAAAAVAEGGTARAKPSRPAALTPDAPEGCCANCRTPLHGPVCHQCGQVDDEYHRPVRGLLTEVFEGITSLDGRVARTIPALLLQPGRVTRDYLKGRRARYMPPFRLYIIASLVFFVFASGLGGVGDAMRSELTAAGTPEGRVALDEARARLEAERAAGEITSEDAAAARAAIDRVDATARAMSGETARQDVAGDGGDGAATVPDAVLSDEAIPAADEEARSFTLTLGGQSFAIDDPNLVRRIFVPEDFGADAPDSILPISARRHVAERLIAVLNDPAAWMDKAADWVPRIMFVMVPVYALLLALVYAWRRGFYLYDHIVVSLHFHSALFLAATLSVWLGPVTGGYSGLGLLAYSNVYLYRLHRAVYRRGPMSSVLRTLLLDSLYLVVLTFGMIVVLLLGALA